MIRVETPAPIDKCPYCGSTYGYYTKDYIQGKCCYNHKFDGTEAENGSMYDMCEHYTGKRAYCIECDKYLFTMKEIQYEGEY